MITLQPMCLLDANRWTESKLETPRQIRESVFIEKLADTATALLVVIADNETKSVTAYGQLVARWIVKND